MRPLAHHAGEESLATLLLLGGGTFSVAVAIGRAKLAAARARLTGRAAAGGTNRQLSEGPPAASVGEPLPVRYGRGVTVHV